MLEAATSARRAPASRCACGAPTVWGSHFCANCGRPVGETPVVACTTCGHPLAADASFCASCGSAAELSAGTAASDRSAEYDVAEGEPEPEPEADGEATIIRSMRSRDRWET